MARFDGILRRGRITRVIATWFLADDPTTASYFPNIQLRSSDSRSAEIYLKCVFDFFLTSRANDPDIDRVFYTNARTLPLGEGDLLETLSSWGVRVVTLPLTYKVPQTWQDKFRNQFYLFDVLESFTAEARPDDWFFLADADCVWYRSAKEIIDNIKSQGLATMTFGTAPDKLTNGLSLNQLGELASQFYGKTRDSVPSYCAGETFGATGATANMIMLRAREAFDFLVDLHSKDQAFACDEAHLLSMLVFGNGLVEGNINHLTKRIWTSHSYSNTAPSDLDLHLWHLPSEKLYGLDDLYNRWSNRVQDYMNLSSDQRMLDLKTTIGIPKPSIRKIVRDRSRRVIAKTLGGRK